MTESIKKSHRTSRCALLTKCFAGILLAGMVAGCGRDDAKVYRVPKESPHSEHSPAMPPGHPDISGGGTPPKITWTLPTGWQEGKRSSLRAASFTVVGKEGATADVAVIPLPPGGSELELVNMWRSQMQLPATSAEDVEKATEAVPVGEGKGKLFEFGSEEPVMEGKRGRILVAVLEREGLNWYFKIAGEDSLVRDQRASFLEFLKSINFAPAPAPSTALAVPTAQAESAHNDGKPHWSVPQGWQETSPGQFLIAKFNVPSEGEAQAAVNISMSSGEGGGWLANVNRWRGQMGLSPVESDELAKTTASLNLPAGKANQVDLSGKDVRTGKTTRSIGVMVQRPDAAWFYRLVGDPALVEREKNAFLEFVKSVNYSHDH